MMQQWHEARKAEFFYKKAKELGYRARSAYKLLEIQEKFCIIKKGDVVVDLGAAPGSWSQAALELAGIEGFVFGVDVQPVLGLGQNFKFVRADITKNKDKMVFEIKNADVVLADLSPEFSGFKYVDMGIAENLAFASLDIARALLKKSGNFVCKVFQSRRFEEFIKEAKKSFRSVIAYKPKASQRGSAEIYLVALDFRKESARKVQTI